MRFTLQQKQQPWTWEVSFTLEAPGSHDSSDEAALTGFLSSVPGDFRPNL